MKYEITESKTTKAKRLIKNYLRDFYWRLITVLSVVIVGSILLTFIDIWVPFNWIVNATYQPFGLWLYAICGACLLWPLALRLKEVLVSSTTLKLTKLKRIPAGLVRGSASTVKSLALLKLSVKRIRG